MPEWIKQLQYLLTESVAVAVVTVIATRGSAPRKIGARMLVTSDRQYGTVGGGNLEYTAIKIARDRHLANAEHPHRQKFALGPALGQCCGGAVELLFETIKIDNFIFECGGGWYCRRIDETTLSSEGGASADDFRNKLQNTLDQIPVSDCFTIVESLDEQWACDRLTSTSPVVFVFGAGHVGSAVVSQLSLLACEIVWVDEREGIFPDQLPARVRCVVSDWPGEEVSAATDGACFIVMTHSHATDFDICKAVLETQQFSFLGLIGSKPKRKNFKKRLAQRGVSAVLLDRLCCPIGIEGIRSNNPEVIALGVAAQLTILWESENQLHDESIID